jgi:ADP-ribose pyrophosphatase YjhB (NUDIX family)
MSCLVKYDDHDNVVEERYQFHMPDMVAIAAFTPDGQLITIYEERPGVNFFHQLPAGAVEKHERRTPRKAAVREFIEEAGFMFKSMKLMTRLLENTAMGPRTCWQYIALDCAPIPDFKPEKAVIKIETMELDKFIGTILDYWATNPSEPHRGIQSFLCASNARYHLDMMMRRRKR